MRPKSCSNYTKLQNLQKNANFWSVEFRKQRVFSGMHRMGQKVHPLNSWFIILTRRNCFKIKWKVYHRHFLRFLVHFEAQNHAVHFLYFYPRDAMLARVLAMALCPSVRLSVCHKSEFCRNGWTIELRVFFLEGFFRPILNCVVRKIQVSTKIRVEHQLEIELAVMEIGVVQVVWLVLGW